MTRDGIKPRYPHGRCCSVWRYKLSQCSGTRTPISKSGKFTVQPLMGMNRGRSEKYRVYMREWTDIWDVMEGFFGKTDWGWTLLFNTSSCHRLHFRGKPVWCTQTLPSESLLKVERSRFKVSEIHLAAVI